MDKPEAAEVKVAVHRMSAARVGGEVQVFSDLSRFTSPPGWEFSGVPAVPFMPKVTLLRALY